MVRLTLLENRSYLVETLPNKEKEIVGRFYCLFLWPFFTVWLLMLLKPTNNLKRRYTVYSLSLSLSPLVSFCFIIRHFNNSGGGGSGYFQLTTDSVCVCVLLVINCQLIFPRVWRETQKEEEEDRRLIADSLVLVVVVVVVDAEYAEYARQ